MTARRVQTEDGRVSHELNVYETFVADMLVRINNNLVGPTGLRAYVQEVVHLEISQAWRTFGDMLSKLLEVKKQEHVDHDLQVQKVAHVLRRSGITNPEALAEIIVHALDELQIKKPSDRRSEGE